MAAVGTGRQSEAQDDKAWALLTPVRESPYKTLDSVAHMWHNQPDEVAMLQAALERAQRNAQRKLEKGVEIFREPNVPDLASARVFVSVLEEATSELNKAAGVSGDSAALVSESVLQITLPLYQHLTSGRVDVASHFLFHTWADYVETFAAVDEQRLEQILEVRAKSAVPTFKKRIHALGGDSVERARVWLINCQLAVQERLVGELTEDRSSATIRRLMTTLRLSHDEVGRMFRVNGETVRRWEKKLVRITLDKAAALKSADAALARLTGILLPDALPSAIRRPAELFGGRRALDWILEGRIPEVVERYELALTYQA